MLIEYTFKFEKNSLTIMQRIEPSASSSQAIERQMADENSLKASYPESKTANTAEPKPGGAGFTGHIGEDKLDVSNSGATAPVTLIGPFIMYCQCDNSKKENEG